MRTEMLLISSNYQARGSQQIIAWPAGCHVEYGGKTYPVVCHLDFPILDEAVLAENVLVLFALKVFFLV